MPLDNAAVLSNVSASATSVTLLAAHDYRVGVLLFNDSSAALYVAYAATSATSAFTVKIAAGGYWEMPEPIYRGVLSGIWDSGTGTARLTELTG